MCGRIALSARTWCGVVLVASLCLVAGCHGARTARPIRLTDGSLWISPEVIAHARAANAWELLRECGAGYRLVEASARRNTAIRRTRGQSSIWVESADQPLVVIDGILMTDPLTLREIPTSILVSVRLLSGPQAGIAYGSNSSAGVIILTTGPKS